MNYKEKQNDFKKRSRMGRFFTKLGTHVISRDGLIGVERSVMQTLFADEKTIQTHDKLSGMQKKVIRKMGWNKKAFLTIN